MIHVKTQPLAQALHQVDEAAAHWVRALNDSRWASVRMSDDLPPRELRFSEPLSRPVKLRLNGSGAQLLVVLDEAQWPSLHVIQQMEDPSRRDAVLNIWACQVKDQLHQVGLKVERCQWEIDARLDAAARVPVKLNGYMVDLYPETASERYVEGLQNFLANLPLPMTVRLAQWPLASSVTLWTRSFSLSRMSSLHVGDLMLLGMQGQAVLRIHGAQSGRSADLVAACQLNTKELTMEEALHEEISAAEFEDEVASTLHGSFAGLQVNVQFEIAGPVMSVAQAIGLAPGEIVVLPTPVDHSRVRLRCQGRCFAYGELVNVGGQMGVRIIEIGDLHVQPK